MPTLQVYTINDTGWSFDRLFRLWREANGDGLDVEFDFSGCGFLRQNAVAFLGGLARLIQHRGGCAVFRWDTLQDAIRTNLEQNGFIDAFGGHLGPWQGNSIPFREDRSEDAHSFQDYLERLWLGRGWVNVSPGLRDAIVGQMAEVYLNAFEHSKSPIGIFTCGQHYPNNHELNLTIVDFGVGIPSNVRLFMANKLNPESMLAASCMQWAFQSGTTTEPPKLGGRPRGLGLDLLCQFVREKRGRLEMFSHEGYACVADGQVRFTERQTFFEGTLVNISLHCDESYYCLASEMPSEPLF